MANVLKNTIPKIVSPRKYPFTVFIEGNIGAGKTTFLNHFNKNENVCLFTEPVDKWRDVQGYNLLVIFIRFPLNFVIRYCLIQFRTSVTHANSVCTGGLTIRRQLDCLCIFWRQNSTILKQYGRVRVHYARLSFRVFFVYFVFSHMFSFFHICRATCTCGFISIGFDVHRKRKMGISVSNIRDADNATNSYGLYTKTY